MNTILYVLMLIAAVVTILASGPTALDRVPQGIVYAGVAILLGSLVAWPPVAWVVAPPSLVAHDPGIRAIPGYVRSMAPTTIAFALAFTTGIYVAVVVGLDTLSSWIFGAAYVGCVAVLLSGRRTR